MAKTAAAGTKRDRLFSLLSGRTPDRIPFIDRMNLWYGAKRYAGTMPERFANMNLAQIHETVGIGRLSFKSCCAHRLVGVDMRVVFEGNEIDRQSNPVIALFPNSEAPPFVSRDKPGRTRVYLSTPVGGLTMEWHVSPNALPMGGISPYLEEHPVKTLDDLPVAEWIVEHLEFVPLFDDYLAEDADLGPDGFAIPLLPRIPFQQVLLEYVGEVPLFYMLADHRDAVERLLAKLDAVMVESLHQLAGLDVPYVEFPDNVDGTMTNPELFARYSVPAYRRYAEILHAQGKKVGSHMDGYLGPLLPLIRDCGLDVVESVCPAPLTEVTFEEVWAALKDGGPVIWGGIPSVLLEALTPEDEFKAFVHKVLDMVGSRPIILGVSDMVIGENLMERVEYIAKAVENHSMEDRPDAAPAVEVRAPAEVPRVVRAANADDLLDRLYDLTLAGDDGPVQEVVADGLARGILPEDMLFDALIPALEEVGVRFEEGSCFVPDMLLSARAMGNAMTILRPAIVAAGVKPLGRLVMGTVRGDVHDIGKNLCITMLEGAGFEVIDLGVDVKEAAFVEAIHRHEPQAVAMSALLTTTTPMLAGTIDAIRESGLRDEVRVLIGGAAVTDAFAASVGADGHAPDASAAVRMAKQVLGVG